MLDISLVLLFFFSIDLCIILLSNFSIAGYMNFNIYPKSKHFSTFLFPFRITVNSSLFFSTILSTLCKWVRFQIIIVKRIKDEIYVCPWTAIVWFRTIEIFYWKRIVGWFVSCGLGYGLFGFNIVQLGSVTGVLWLAPKVN